MDQNNTGNSNKPQNDKNGRNRRGIISLMLWALVLTFGLNYLTTYVANTAAAASSHEIAYSDFIDLVETG